MIADARWRDLWRVIRHPVVTLDRRLKNPESAKRLLLHLVLPGAAIHGIAAFARSMLLNEPAVGVVLGLGTIALQVGVWHIVTRLGPTICEQVDVALPTNVFAELVALSSVPLWLMGIIQAVPETLPFLYYWSRTLFVLGASLGVLVAYSGLVFLGVQRERLVPLLGGIAGVYAATYAALFVVLGILAHVTLFLWH